MAQELISAYTLQTISGNLPNLPTTGKVYLVGINKSRLTSLDRIRGIATTLGFTNDLTALDSENYRFVHTTIPAEIVTNIVSWKFTFKYDWTGEGSIYNNHAIPAGNDAINRAKVYYRNIGLLNGDLDTGNGVFKYFVATGSAMTSTDSFYNANFTRVDLYRADKDGMPVVTSGGDTSPVNIIFTPFGGNKSVAQANYEYSLTVDNDFATYPLKGIDQAWSELKSGGGYIVKPAGNNIVVRKVYMGYYESDEPQQFLQSVYVFEGDNGFKGYVAAVAPALIIQPATPAVSTPNQ